MVFTVIGTIITILGFIGAILTGVLAHNFFIGLGVFVSMMLSAAIYYGFGMILANQREINGRLDLIDSRISRLEYNLLKPETQPGNMRSPKPNNAPPAQNRNQPEERWKCSSCGTYNPVIVTRCLKCGEKDTFRQLMNNAQSSVGDPVMNPNAGYANIGPNAFRQEGYAPYPQNDSNVKWRCPKCHTPYMEDVKSCPVCGTKNYNYPE